MRRLLLVLIAGGVLAAPAAAPAADPPERLAVLDAERGTLADGRLTLHGVSPRATWFLDRPFHAAGVRSTWALVPAYFKAGTGRPNAAIELTRRGGGRDTIVVELASARVDRGARSIAFRARVLPATPDGLSAWDARRIAQPPPTFGRATVFLDGSWQSCTMVVALPNGMTAADGTLTNWYGTSFTPTSSLSAGGGEVGTQSGGWDEGCGGGVTYALSDGTTLTITWDNPEVGGNSASCWVSESILPCTTQVGSGDNPVFDFVVG